MGEVIQLGGPVRKAQGFASIGEQLRKLEKAPLPLRIIASPKLTGALAGGLLGGGIGAVKGLFLAGTTEGLVEASPKVEEFIKKRFVSAGEKGGEAIGGIIEDPKKLLPSRPPKQKVEDVLKGAGLVGAGALAGAGIPKIIEKVKKKGKRVKSELKSLSPTTAPAVVGTPAFSGGVPTAPARIEVPTESIKVKEAPPKPMNITQKVRIDIVNKPKATNKRYLNTICLPIK